MREDLHLVTVLSTTINEDEVDLKAVDTDPIDVEIEEDVAPRSKKGKFVENVEQMRIKVFKRN